MTIDSHQPWRDVIEGLRNHSLPLRLAIEVFELQNRVSDIDVDYRLVDKSLAGLPDVAMRVIWVAQMADVIDQALAKTARANPDQLKRYLT